ncbi:hypothetical protein HW555_010383 [Spodoptera exigua]|uniref:Gag-like protein n=1 Tax=Spodoptera exigua TaxID=7107 RepID=A0A835KZV9_SPOEX|nr:hypothetical protein HW555_010383 [Spodoptera exigua]
MDINTIFSEDENTNNMTAEKSVCEEVSTSDTELEQYHEEILVHAKIEGEIQSRPEKREREEEESEWTLVNRKEKKVKSQNEKIELYMSSNEKLPKQFALARLFKSCGIININRVKYINPYKVRIDVDNELIVDKIEKCQEFINNEWKVHRAMERNTSYGVIREVDLDLSEEDILERISCEKPIEIISLQRLKRRDRAGEGWQPSESVRICFRGSYIPPVVYVDGLRIKVTPYLFPVSQCSKCWKYGHTYKKCPYNKVVCPKCGGNHNNCETEIFKCVNCGGQHMSLAKTLCPVFLREKKLRDLMMEFNCTYRKALTMYVPPSPANIDRDNTPLQSHPIPVSTANTQKESTSSFKTPPITPTFSEILQAKVGSKNNKKQNTSSISKTSQKQQSIDIDNIDIERPSIAIDKEIYEQDEKQEGLEL